MQLLKVWWFPFRSLVLLLFLQLVSGCALPWRHQVSHAGFNVLIRSDWVDSSETPDAVNVWSKWGGISVVVRKLPGQSEYHLGLMRRLLAVNRTEEKLTEWFQFSGHGSRFRTYDCNGEIQEEDVVFFPEGAFAGFYINASNRSAQSDARKQYEQVIKSSRRN